MELDEFRPALDAWLDENEAALAPSGSVGDLDGDSFLVLYEITGDVEAAKGNLAAALKSGSMSRPVTVQLDPPPTMQYLRDIGEHRS